jgi:predicted  nucleic acid-binding Zn-ribbon protein
MWKCLECGRKFKTAKAAERAANNGCPKCGGVDVDDVPEEPTEADLDYAYRVHGGSKVSGPPARKQPEDHYVIRDTQRGGYAEDNPIEGWCLTILANNAAKFATAGDALAVIRQHYGSDTTRFVVEPVKK